MAIIVILGDGETWDYLDNCSVCLVDDELVKKDFQEALDEGETLTLYAD
jgi:hypothetical protein